LTTFNQPEITVFAFDEIAISHLLFIFPIFTLMSVPIQNSCQEEAANMSTPVETDIFIVGAGPAGGSLASFLAQNGISTPAFQKVTY
jgi:hypothetical protein